MQLETITVISLTISIVVGILSNRIFMGRKRGKYKLLEEAKRKGNVVQGYIADTEMFLGDPNNSNSQLRYDRVKVTYHYSVNGKTYKKVMRFQSEGHVSPNFPGTVQVYYKASNPKVAVCPQEATELGRKQSGCMGSIIIGFITMAIVFNVIRALFGIV